jgi:putative ABC transport system permease protein
VEAIKKVLQTFSGIEIVTTQLHISGMLSNGEVSNVFLAVGRVASDFQAIKRRGKGWVTSLDLFSGKPLEDKTPYGVGLSSGLAKDLELGLGSEAIAMAPTISGQINALDVKVFQLFDAGLELLNNMLMVVPIQLAQSLYDTASVDRVVVLLDRSEDAEKFRDALLRALNDRHLNMEVKTWKELDAISRKVEEMFDIIFVFIFFIVLVIVVMSVVNTMSMAIVERTREIGTLRALGVKRYGIVKLFAIESALLGVLGCLLGTVLTLMSWIIVSVILRPTWVPPIITKRVPLDFYLVPEYIAYSAVFLILLSVFSAILPARKAAHREIIDALEHV